MASVIARYRAEIPALMAQEDVPGLSLAVVDRSGIVWQHGFGSTDAHGGSSVTADTLFSIQSASKVFTATAVMQAVQAGILDLDAPITTYLPHFTVHSAFESHPEQRITLRMLLSHTAGFTQEAPVGNSYEPDPGEFDAHVRSISRTWLRFPAGSGLAYSNLGIDLAGYILEKVWNEPFPVLMRRSLLEPVGMNHSTFDRTQVHATAARAVGSSESPVPQPVDIGEMAAGGLWASAADVGRFLRFQLGDGSIDGRTVLDAPLMEEMRTVAAPKAGAAAGYGMGVALTRWREGRNVDLFYHLGGGLGFTSELWWLPRLGLGIAVLTNRYPNSLPGTLAERILYDLVTQPGSKYHQRMLALPTRPDVVEPNLSFVPPEDLAERIRGVAMPRSREQSRRWSAYSGRYRTGEPGAMDPVVPASRFHVESGVPYFDAAEEGTAVRHRLTEFQRGLFISDDGETLDLRGPTLSWRGVRLNRVNGGPLPLQWALLAAVALVAAWWLSSQVIALRRRRRRAADHQPGTGAECLRGHAWRTVTVAVASCGAAAALATVAAVLLAPGLVDVGFLGWLAWPIPFRLALHLPLALALLAAGLLTLLVLGAIRGWWSPRVKGLDATLALALAALATQLAVWHLVAWGF